jgi:hypothetical protein
MFVANSDGDTKVRNDLKKGVMGRTIRICPVKWHKHISMRFEAIFV